MQNDVSSLLADAAQLMLVGMVFVFMFLGLMIASVQLIARFCEKFPGPQPAEQRSTALSKPAQAQTEQVPPSVVAAISAAIHKYRQGQ